MPRETTSVVDCTTVRHPPQRSYGPDHWLDESGRQHSTSIVARPSARMVPTIGWKKVGGSTLPSSLYSSRMLQQLKGQQGLASAGRDRTRAAQSITE